MTVYYKGNPIKEVQSQEEARAFITAYRSEIDQKCKYFIDKARELVDVVSSTRPRELGESLEEYEEYIRLTYPDLLKEMEDLGKGFYGDKYIKTYYYNSKDCTVGYVVITQEGTKRKESLENLSLSAWTRSAFPQLFEVK